jgi:hypothetical protein
MPGPETLLVWEDREMILKDYVLAVIEPTLPRTRDPQMINKETKYF